MIYLIINATAPSLFFDNLFSIGTVFAMIIDREKILREDIEREQM